MEGRLRKFIAQAQQLRSIHITSVDEVLRSEEHTSELQSHSDLVCRLLLEKKKVRSETGFLHPYFVHRLKHALVAVLAKRITDHIQKATY